MRRYAIPDAIAYHDGTRYHCYSIECFANGATLKEIDRIPRNILTYLPVLQCSECGATYFGIDTRDLEAEKVIKQYHEQRERREKERTENARILAEMDAEAFYQEEARREAEQRRECEEHASKLAGDIELPNIVAEPQREHPRRDEGTNNGDIILPNTITI